jgi:solute carrier family 25 carnitine/acylcarnitine transporter 20/29
MIVGGLAGISCWIFSYPQDLIKTHLQVEDNVYKENKFLKDGGFFECGKEIYRKAGFKGLFRGIEPCLIRAFVANAVGIAIYEKAQ